MGGHLSTRDVLARLERWGADRDWIGPDPYEGLSSPLGRLTRSKLGRQLVIQAYKRSPVAPPWPLRPPPAPNAKALALALSGYASRAGSGLAGAGRFIDLIPRRLERMALTTGSGPAWGYPFDAQTRHLFYDRSTPNAIATCFVINALCDHAAATGAASSNSLALRARPFLLSLLKDSHDGPFFAYVEAGSELIHNANVMVAGTLARLDGVEPDPAARAAAEEAAATTIRRQREDGLWPYGEAGNLGWADNFHTAYTLEGLARLRTCFGIGEEALVKGFGAWRDRFFLPDGSATFHADRPLPLDTHSSASAIDCVLDLATVAGIGAQGASVEVARTIADAAIRDLWMPKRGCFAFGRTRRGLNPRVFVRWTNAPMFRALARLASAEV